MQEILRFISMFSLCQAGATPGGLQLRGACFGPAGSGHKINRTFLCHGSQPAGNATIARAIDFAGLRGARLRPARPKGRKECPCHLTVLLICRLKPGASEGKTELRECCSPAPGVAPGWPLRG